MATLRIFKIPDPTNPTQSIGIKPKLLITGAAVSALKGRLLDVPTQEVEDVAVISEFGTPIYDYLHLRDGSYTDLDGTVINYTGLIFYTVLIEVNRPKNIIKTPVQGRNGTIKEYVSDGDFVINVSGVIASKDNVFPTDEMDRFKKLMDVPQQISVTSDYLNTVFGIDDIVIENFQSNQIEGTRNMVSISFQALSDVPLDVEVLE